MAQQLLQKYPTDSDRRWTEAFRRLTSRTPNEEELAVLRDLFAEQKTYFESHGNAAKDFLAVGEQPRPEGLEETELAASTVVVLTVINFDETMTKR